jgi:UDP-N-acetylmuramate dehydrogenase
MTEPRGHVPLAPLTTLGVGGSARWFLSATSTADVRAAHQWARERSLPLLVLAGGSNVVIADTGWDGLVMHVRLRGLRFEPRGADTIVHTAAGEPWDEVVAAAVDRGLAGIECLSGIPGSAGGTPIQNVGAYGQEVRESVETVTVFDRADRDLRELSADDCGFAYRTSRFKGVDAGRFVVCDVAFRLRPGPPLVRYPDLERQLHEADLPSPAIADVRRAVITIRRRKGMVLDASDADTRSVGSFFTNPVVSEDARDRVASLVGRPVPGYPAAGGVKLPAAWLIESAGFRRGHRDGAAGISTKHPLAIVTRGGATARDVVRLAARVKRQVWDRLGVALIPEPVFVGFGDDAEVAYLIGGPGSPGMLA